MAELKLIRGQDAPVIMEGSECVHLYFQTDKILFDVATVPAGQRTPVDPGHQGAHEVAYLIKGHVVFEFPAQQRFMELFAGDAVLIPEGEPHVAINVGEETAMISWSLAPHLGREAL